MSIENLYKLADNILDLKNKEGSTEYKPISFYTLISGSPATVSNLNIPILFTRTLHNKYGSGCEICIKCKALEGILDLDYNQIYEAENGILFVYVYRKLFTSELAYFSPPRLDMERDKDCNHVFSMASEHLMDEFFPDESYDSLKLVLGNKITRLQEIAFMQGRGKSILNR